MWTDAELESLHMVANGVSLAAQASSSVDFFNGGTLVAYITRNITPSTTATMTCKGGAFGSGVEYAVSYLGWEEPEPVTLVTSPSLPASAQSGQYGYSILVSIEKSNGAIFTESEMTALSIVVNDTQCVIDGTAIKLDGRQIAAIDISQAGSTQITIDFGGPTPMRINSITLG